MVLAYPVVPRWILFPHGPLRKNGLLFLYKMVFLYPTVVHVISKIPKKDL